MHAESVDSLPRYSGSRHLLVLILLFIAALIAYLPSFAVPFQYDDLWEIVGNHALDDLGDWRTILRYNPARALLMLTFALDRYLWGYYTLPYHIENFVIHLVNSLLVYQIAERLLSRSGERPRTPPGGLDAPSGWSPALGIGLIFAVHPLFVEAVTYIASRSSSLTTLFYLAAFSMYIRFRDVQSEQPSRLPAWLWLALSVNFYLLSIFTKEEGVSLPAILLAYDLLIARPGITGRNGRRIRRSWWLGSLPFWVVFGLIVMARVQLVGTLMPPVEVRGIPENLATTLEATLKYIRLLCIPYGLNIYHDYPVVTDPLNFRTLLAALAHVGILGIAFSCRKRIPLVSLGILWFYITLSPTSSVIPLKEVMAEHRMYLGSIGPLWIVGLGLGWAREKSRVPAWGVGVILCIPLAVITFQYNRLWQNSIALWERAVTLAPYSGDAYYALGDALARKNRLKEAEEAYQKSIHNYVTLGIPQAKYKYSYVDALNNVGLVYARQGDLDRAISHFRRALQVNERYTQGWNNLGYAQLQKGLYLEATFAFEEAVTIDPESWLGHYHLGDIFYDKMPDRDKAIFHYRRALEINPGIPNSDEIKRRVLELEL